MRIILLIPLILLSGCNYEGPYLICWKEDKIIYNDYGSAYQMDYGYWKVSNGKVIKGRCRNNLGGKPLWLKEER